MTTLVWDGTTLAADTQGTNGTRLIKVQKIFHRSGHLLGIVGDMALALEKMHWYLEGAHPDTFPTSAREAGSSTLLVITPERKALLFQNSPFPLEPQGPITEGSGAEAAQAALIMGASAERAVEVACQVDAFSGLPVETLTF